jgi:hypothetical protein
MQYGVARVIVSILARYVCVCLHCTVSSACTVLALAPTMWLTRTVWLAGSTTAGVAECSCRLLLGG